MSVFRVAVLASGDGSNLQALLDRFGVGEGRDGVAIVAVAGEKEEAHAFARARVNNVAAVRAFPARAFAGGRVQRDAAMASWLGELDGIGVDLVVLAGYRQIVSPAFLAAFGDRVINVHPALLPAFPGLHAVEQALAYGAKVFGVTVHFVDEGVDSGPVIAQEAVTLPSASRLEDVMPVLHEVEHALLPEVVLRFARGQVRRDPDHARRVLSGDGALR